MKTQLTGTSANAVAYSTLQNPISAGLPKALTGATEATATLQAAEAGKPEGSSNLTRAVAASLAAVALLGAMPANADTTVNIKPPPVAERYLDQSELTQTRYGTADYEKLLGLKDTAQVTLRSADVDARAAAAFKTFGAKLDQVLQRDAGSLAAGLRPVDPNNLNSAQAEVLKDAFRDLVQSIPIGAFAPEVKTGLESTLGALGDKRDLSNATLKDFGKLGGDAAKDLVKNAVGDFKDNHPAAFYSIAGAAGAAAVAVGYTQGTEALAKLGLKPELKTKLFGDVSVKLGVLTGPKFSDPRTTVGLEGKHTFDNGTVLRGGVQAQLAGKTLTGAEANVNVATAGGFNLDGKVRLDGSGQPFDASLSASQRFQHDNGQGVVFAQGQWSNGENGTANAASATVGYAGTHGRWTTGVSGTYDFKSDTFSSSLSAGRTFDLNRKDDLEVQIRGSLNSRGDSQIGVGVRLSF